MSGITGGWNARENFIYQQDENALVNPIEITSRRGDSQEFKPVNDPAIIEKFLRILNGNIKNPVEKQYAENESVEAKRAQIMKGSRVEMKLGDKIYKFDPIQMNDTPAVERINKVLGKTEKVRFVSQQRAEPLQKQDAKVSQAVAKRRPVPPAPTVTDRIQPKAPLRRKPLPQEPMPAAQVEQVSPPPVPPRRSQAPQLPPLPEEGPPLPPLPPEKKK